MTNTKAKILIGLALILTVGCSHIQKRQTKVEELGIATLDGTQSYALEASNINQTFRICVALPMQPVEKGKLLPVVYVLDVMACSALRNWHLKSCSSVVTFLK